LLVVQQMHFLTQLQYLRIIAKIVEASFKLELVYPFARDLAHWEVIIIVFRVSKELYGRSSDILWFPNEHWNKPYGSDICN